MLSRHRKHTPGLSTECWWITEAAAEALRVAEALSWHPTLAFAGGHGGAARALRTDNTEGSFESGDAVKYFIAHVNRATATTGLAIPPGRATPQQFRTMAMLVAARPGGEIAVNLQLKHVATRALANQVTQGYWATDTA